MPHIFVPAFLVFLSLTGCDFPLLWTKGSIADQQRDLMLISLLLMLIVVIPVLAMTALFAWRYRASNTKASYTPEWDDDYKLELVWWGIPMIIILILAVITWKASHRLDPYRPLQTEQEHLEIEVIALDWKWLFIYPQYDIAVVNHVRFPVHTPIRFKITAQAPMNSFWIPHLAGQIYAMEGMQTLLHVDAHSTGEFPGLSSNFSGEGFHGMKFIAKAVETSDFITWVDSVKTAGDTLSRFRYDLLAVPSKNEPVRIFSSVQPQLFQQVMWSYMTAPEKTPTPAAPACHKHDHSSNHRI